MINTSKRKMTKSFGYKMIENIEKIIKLLDKYSLRERIEFNSLYDFLGKYNNSPSTEYHLSMRLYLPIDGFGINGDSIKNESSEDIEKNKKIRVEIELKFTLDEKSSCDLFSSYNCNIEFFLMNNTNPSFSWHLDREENTDGDFVHPRYHFQAGGHSMEHINQQHVCFFSSPRLPHPPMDVILLLHFIIQNFINSGTYSNKKKLLEDNDYQCIIGLSQKHVLDKYFEILYNGKSDCETITSYNLFPLLGWPN